MMEVGRRYESARTGGWVQVTRRTSEQLVIERLLKPDTGYADPHLHNDFVQTWECVTGYGALEVDGSKRGFRAGDRMELPLGTGHRDPYNPGEADMVIRGTFDPVTEFLEAYASAWAHHLREGTVNDQDEMSILQIVALVRATDGESYRTGIPVAVQKAAAPLIERVARLRGYKASYD
jgi:mannose-6-phosphate isomerase-like protein (cupin superfamily)